MANNELIPQLVIACIPAVIAYIASRRHTKLQIEAQQVSSEAGALREMIEATEKKALRYFTLPHAPIEIGFLGTELVSDVGNISRRINAYKNKESVQKKNSHDLKRLLIEYRQSITGDDPARGGQLPLNKSDARITKIRIATDSLAAAIAACQ